VVRKTTIRRGCFTGPCFDVDAAGIFAAPCHKSVRKKFAKSYNSVFPMELLLYHERQPVLPDAVWASKPHDSLALRVEGSQFRRVWIFDVQSNAVTFVRERQ
jgi:hypothetical protein